VEEEEAAEAVCLQNLKIIRPEDRRVMKPREKKKESRKREVAGKSYMPWE